MKCWRCCCERAPHFAATTRLAGSPRGGSRPHPLWHPPRAWCFHFHVRRPRVLRAGRRHGCLGFASSRRTLVWSKREVPSSARCIHWRRRRTRCLADRRHRAGCGAQRARHAVGVAAGHGASQPEPLALVALRCGLPAASRGWAVHRRVLLQDFFPAFLAHIRADHSSFGGVGLRAWRTRFARSRQRNTARDSRRSRRGARAG